MAASFVTVSAALVSLMTGVTGVGEVKASAASEFSKFPAVSIFMSGNENQYLDSANNLVGYRFTIRIVDEYKTSPETTEARMMALADAIISALDKSDDLSGLVQILSTATTKAGFLQAEMGDLRTIFIDVVARASSVI